MMKVQKQITHPLVSSEQAWVTKKDHGMGKWISMYLWVYALCLKVNWHMRSVWYFVKNRYVATIS